MKVFNFIALKLINIPTKFTKSAKTLLSDNDRGISNAY